MLKICHVWTRLYAFLILTITQVLSIGSHRSARFEQTDWSVKKENNQSNRTKLNGSYDQCGPALKLNL